MRNNITEIIIALITEAEIIGTISDRNLPSLCFCITLTSQEPYIPNYSLCTGVNCEYCPLFPNLDKKKLYEK